MHLWSTLSEHFKHCSSFTHPHDYQELIFQIRKFIFNTCDQICFIQLHLSMINDIQDNLFCLLLSGIMAHTLTHAI